MKNVYSVFYRMRQVLWHSFINAGFGPGTASLFRKMIGLPLLNWEEIKMKYDKIFQTDKATIPKEQKSLSDYL